MKRATILSATFLAMSWMLFGCSNDQTEKSTTSDQAEENSEETEKANESSADKEKEADEKEIDINKFIEDVTKANKELKSFSMDSKVDMIQTYGKDENHIVNTHEQDVIFEPFQSKKHAKSKQQNPSGEEEQNMYDEEMTIYVVDGVNYVNLKAAFGDGKQWYKEENKFSDEEMRKQEMIDVKKLLENLKDMTNDKTLSEEDGKYILTLDIDTDKLTEMEKQNPQLAQSDDEKANKQMKDTYIVEQMDYKITFDKKSKYMSTMESTKKYSYEMDFQDKTDTMKTVEKTITNYKNQNKVEDIVLPDEVLENAVESNK